METKRNPLPRLGAAVLVLTLATTALLSGTMAKYKIGRASCRERV